MKLTDFFNSEYVNFSSYDNVRKIASVMDGQKNASRKILHTIQQKNIKTLVKVSQLGSKVGEFTEYLHGSMDTVIVNLGKNYVGTNNVPLLQKSGNFGTRFTHAASASRYIYTHGTDVFFDLFKLEDFPVLEHQTFENADIEPKFFVPTLPVLLLNGAEGVSSGFAQKILPRNPETVKLYVQAVLTKKETPELLPFFRGFKGNVTVGTQPGQYNIEGTFDRVSVNKIMITEIPVHYSLKSYLKVLDTLEDNGVIKTYRDRSENDNFKFEVTMSSADLKQMTDADVLSKLKLVKIVSENYTVMDETNTIKVHENVDDIVTHFVKIKLKYTALRLKQMLNKLVEQTAVDSSKMNFVKGVLNDKILINNQKKTDVVQVLKSYPGIIQVNGNWDYLLNMNILSLTKERADKLQNDIHRSEKEIIKLKKTTPTKMFMSDIARVKSIN